MNPYFPFHALGFKCNPFRTLTDDEWGEIAILPESILDTLRDSSHIQILGEIGRGKTTTLMGLQTHYKRAGKHVIYEYIPQGQSYFNSRLDSVEIFLLDEAQRVKSQALQGLLTRENLKIILSTHQDFTPLIPSIVTFRLGSITPDHLRHAIESRLTYFALNAQSDVCFADDAVDYLYQKFGSDLRGVEKFLYEVFQGLKERKVIKEKDLRDF